MKSKTCPFFVLLLTLLFTFNSTLISAQSGKFKVVLDAGHGGHDSGASYNGIHEKDIALNITLLAGGILERHKDIQVIYTRKTDVFLGLRERADIANKANADLFVSIHANAARNTAAYGAETFVLGLHKSQENFEVAKKENQVIYLEENYEEIYGGFDPSSPESLIGLILSSEVYLDQSIEVAALVQNNFTQRLKRRDRSVKQAGFWVLHNTYMPSVLIETGFVSNREEAAYLNSRKGQQEMGQAIADAIIDYYNSIKSSYTTTTQTTRLPVTENVPAVTQSEVHDGVVFKVQIAASSRRLDTKPGNFKGLTMISREQEGDLYRYFYGSTSDYVQIKELQKTAREKGYPSAFIVAFKNGKRVNLTDVIN
jgi:N-acetylmuramoyl-L-alanine amidase